MGAEVAEVDAAVGVGHGVEGGVYAGVFDGAGDVKVGGPDGLGGGLLEHFGEGVSYSLIKVIGESCRRLAGRGGEVGLIKMQ